MPHEDRPSWTRGGLDPFRIVGNVSGKQIAREEGGGILRQGEGLAASARSRRATGRALRPGVARRLTVTPARRQTGRKAGKPFSHVARRSAVSTGRMRRPSSATTPELICANHSGRAVIGPPRVTPGSPAGKAPSSIQSWFADPPMRVPGLLRCLRLSCPLPGTQPRVRPHRHIRVRWGEPRRCWSRNSP